MNRSRNGVKPQVLVLCQLFYPELVSTGQTMTELCEALADKGADVEVICAQPTYLKPNFAVSNFIKYKGIKIKRVWSTQFPKSNLIGRIINQAAYAVSVFIYLIFNNSNRPILVLTNPPYLAFFCALLKVLKVGNPYIYLIFDVYPDTAINLNVINEKGLITKLWNIINNYSLKHSTHIVVIGRCMEKIIRDKFNQMRHELKDNVSVIHVWSDDRIITPNSDKNNMFRKKWGLDGKFVISYSGNMGRFHDMETIMEVAKRLLDNDNIAFVFVGEGHKKQWMIEYANRHALKNCQFHSYVERENLGKMLTCADIGLVSLSEGQEGLSVPSKSYGIMAAGIPIIGIMSSNSEIAMVIKEEKCGIVVDTSDVDGLLNAITNLYNNSKLLTEMGLNARKAIDTKYSLNSAAESYLSLISNLGRVKHLQNARPVT
jgi:glycosyltransferase involved in cell wall biosynthesis